MVTGVRTTPKQKQLERNRWGSSAIIRLYSFGKCREKRFGFQGNVTFVNSSRFSSLLCDGGGCV